MHTAPALLDLQRCFLDALYDATETGPAEQLVDVGIDPAARLRIYRHNSELIHLEALRTTFPAVVALVGDAFFEHAAAPYRGLHPSRSGNLQTFGEHFPEYLEQLPNAQRLPYLGDVARLEWRRQLAALASDTRPLTSAEFESTLAALEGPVRMAFHPSMQRFVSAYPVLALWQYATQPTAERLTLPESGDRVLLWRSDGEVAMAAIDTASFACIDALARGDTLDAAHAEASAIDPSFDLPSCITSLVAASLVTKISPVQHEEGSSCK